MPTRLAAELALAITGILGISRGDVLASAGNEQPGSSAFCAMVTSGFGKGETLPIQNRPIGTAPSPEVWSAGGVRPLRARPAEFLVGLSVTGRYLQDIITSTEHR